MAAAPAQAQTKKEKKKKQGKRTLNLNEFLAGTPVARTVKVATGSWADEVDDDNYGRGPVEAIELPTAPRAARGVDIDMDRVPTRPPFTAYIGNLPFDVEEPEIEGFFHGLDVVNIRIPDGRLKKFGYVEFADRQTLLEALALDDQKMRNNLIRVDLAEGQTERDSDRNRRGGFGDRDRGEDYDDSRTEGDWRKKGPSDGPPARGFGDRDRGGGFGDRDRGGFGDRDRGGFGDRDRDRGGFGGDRDRGSYGDRDRGSFGGDRDRGSFGGDRYGDRDRGSFGGDRQRSGGFDSWDRNRDRDRGGSSFGDRDRDDGRRSFGSGYRDSGDRGGSGRYGDRYGGGRDDRYGYRDRYDRMESRGDDRGPSRESAGGERPRLKLAPRTKPVEAAPQSSSSIFGGAKPVDTAAREREIEDRLKRQHDFEREKVDQERETRETRLSSSTSDRGRHGSQGDDTAPRRERERKSSSSSGKGIRTVAPPPGAGSARIRRDSTLSEPEDVFEEAEKPASVPEGTPVSPSATKTSPKKEDASPVPAPPPKENPWGKRAESKPNAHAKEETKPVSEPTSPKPSNQELESKSPKEASPKNVQPATPPKTNAWSKGKPEIIPADPPKENAWAKRSSQSADPANKENRISKDNGTKDGETGFSGSHWGSNRQRREGVGQVPQPPANLERGTKPTREKRERPLPKSIDEMPQYSAKSDKDWSDANKFSFLMGDEDNGDGADQ